MRIGLLAVVTTVALALAAGCSSSQPVAPPTSSQAPPPITQGELCDVLKKFFTTELHAVDARTIPNISTDALLKHGGVCELAQGQNPIGSYSVRNAPDDADPTWGRRGFVMTPELGEAVWVYDLRTDQGNPSNTVRFATRINKWNAVLEIRDTETQTDKGELHLTDDDKRKSVKFLTELTTRLAVDR